MYNYPYNLLSIWPELSLLYRSFVLILIGVGVYSVTSAAISLKLLHNIQKAADSGHKEQLVLLHYRCVNLNQVLRATFYLFGFLLFVNLPSATNTLGDGRELLMVQILNGFVLQFVFAANVFFVFLLLHCLQWIVSSRVHARMHFLS